MNRTTIGEQMINNRISIRGTLEVSMNYVGLKGEEGRGKKEEGRRRREERKTKTRYES